MAVKSKIMVQIIYEEDPYNPVYKDELEGELIKLENTIKEFSEKYNIILVFNGRKYPNELACLIKSTTVKLPK